MHPKRALGGRISPIPLSNMAMTSNMTMMTSLAGISAPFHSAPKPRAWAIAARVPAPGCSGATLADLGILRDVVEYDQGDVHVQILTALTPRVTEDAIREHLVQALTEEGFRRVDVEAL